MLKGFRNFLLRGDVIVIAVGLAIALGFTTLVKAFTTDIITPLVARIQGKDAIALGVQLGRAGNANTLVNFGDLISTIIYFLVLVAVVYYLVVVPYRALMARRGVTVFGDPAPTQTCPACASDDLAVAATKCKYCGTVLGGA